MISYNDKENILKLFGEMLRSIKLADIVQDGVEYKLEISFKMENLGTKDCRMHCKKIDMTLGGGTEHLQESAEKE